MKPQRSNNATYYTVSLIIKQNVERSLLPNHTDQSDKDFTKVLTEIRLHIYEFLRANSSVWILQQESVSFGLRAAVQKMKSEDRLWWPHPCGHTDRDSADLRAVLFIQHFGSAAPMLSMRAYLTVLQPSSSFTEAPWRCRRLRLSCK